jgi:glucose/arabinose dehydrogenase
MRRRSFLALGGLSALAGGAAEALAGCGTAADPPGAAPATGGGPGSAPGSAPASGSAPAAGTGAPEAIATGLNVPWAIAFLPGGDALVSERETGRVVRVPAGGGGTAQVMRIPDVATDDSSEGGLLGLAVSPGYASDGLVYAYYTTRTDNRIVRFSLGGAVRPILTGLRRGNIHNGGRIAFGPDGKLYAGVGETGNKGLAQQRTSRNGKILRINPDGSVPADNPFGGSPVWSYGHRNVQGLAWDKAGRLWATEFGQNRLDEVNLIQPGHNYGWPVVEGRGDTHGGAYTNPLVTWPTDEASPSGAAIIGNIMYIGALRGTAVLRVKLDGAAATAGTALFRGVYGRIRAVAAAPDGRLWFATSNRDGRGKPHGGDDHIYALAV